VTKALAKPADELREVLKGLTARQREVIEQLPLFRGQLYTCAEALGISSRTVWRWTREPRFRAARALLDEIALDAIGVNTAQVLGEVARIALADVRKLFRADGSLLPPTEWDDANAAAIAGFDVEDIYEGSGKDRTYVGTMRKVKRTDRLKALELLGRHKRLWGEDKPLPAAPEGPGLTVIVEQRVVGAGGVVAQQVVVNLQPPE
jgi:hypothetical protein